MNRPATFAAPARASFSADEFVQMLASGGLDDLRLELVDGELERMSPPMSGHAAHQSKAILRLARAVDEARIMVEIGIRIDAATVLVCDAAVLRAPVAGNRLLEPADVALVVEVAETTLDRDTGVKRRKYAAAGIETYWVIDTQRRVTHVYREPVEGDYALIATARFGEPLAVPGTDAAITLD